MSRFRGDGFMLWSHRIIPLSAKAISHFSPLLIKIKIKNACDYHLTESLNMDHINV